VAQYRRKPLFRRVGRELNDHLLRATGLVPRTRQCFSRQSAACDSVQPAGQEMSVKLLRIFWFGEVVTVAELVCMSAAWVSAGRPRAIVHTPRFMGIGIKIMDEGRRIRHTTATRIGDLCANRTYFSGQWLMIDSYRLECPAVERPIRFVCSSAWQICSAHSSAKKRTMRAAFREYRLPDHPMSLGLDPRLPERSGLGPMPVPRNRAARCPG
jgi:hypothetical protein